ncbi:MAG: glycosyltransferase [Pontixanthobacter sp.]
MNDVVSIIIPTHNRPELLARSIGSALAQTDVEVVVVDDASDPPATIPEDPRIRLIRSDRNVGISRSRNIGLREATGRFIAYLDDDDILLPNFARDARAAFETCDLAQPIGVLSAMEVIDEEGRLIDTRVPPTLEKGRDYAFEKVDTRFSFNAKQTLFIETAVLRQIGGWDESFLTRGTSEMFLRLNRVASLFGIETVGYRQFRHAGPRLSTDDRMRERSFRQLRRKHRAVLKAHPAANAVMLIEHARTLRRHGIRRGIGKAVVQAFLASPRSTARELFGGKFAR